MVVLTSDVVYSRLQDVKNPTQEAIETMSMWIMHYKDNASIDLIVDGWLNCFKTAGTDNKRIALFYVMNDVVQKAKMKHADTLIPAFQPAVLTAVGIGRKQDKVKAVMKRCIQIFKSRNVFSPASTTAMENLLASDADEGYEAEDQALEVDSDDLVKKITNFISARNVVADMMKCVNEGNFDYKEMCKHGMRDREEGGHILHEVHEAIDTMVQVRHSMEDQKKKMMALSETLELAKRVFLHQKREVLVVEEAYVNFRDGIKAVHTELLDMEAKKVYPGLLSPRNEDDRQTYGRSNNRSLSQQWGDNRNQIDMEMDEDERPQAPMMKPSLQALVGIASQPSLQSRIMQLGLKKIANGDEEMFQPTTTTTADTPLPSTFQPPPSKPAVINASKFSMPPPAITSAPLSDPRIRSDGEGPSQYAIALKQHGLPPPTGQQPVQNRMNAPPPAQPSPYQAIPQKPVEQTVYQGQFGGARDPRLANSVTPQSVAVAQQPPITGYQAQYEQIRDPRILQQAAPQQGYQATFEVQKPQLVSPQIQNNGYQARFEQSQLSPSIPQHQPVGQYHQQKNTYCQPPPQHHQYQQQSQQSHGYSSDYHSGDRRDDRGRDNYQNSRYDDRRGSSAPYNNQRGDRWRGSGSHHNDRNRNSGRDSWRGGNHRSGGGYHRY
ncbi:CID domain-containing protein [Caenorhabditis elegans]|uniref:CID domain-containing protein n=1 Tax=Caenorhabditis elegans TaxID=6239 RepID=A5Z2V0_CAEEL|nr:CID domain-containing protein [Caenorhabditis elegans]CAN99679.1 CID domain-containing protein [Caenorhabditis elegans]|eukprot:NP_001122471.1 pol II C-terminal Interaction Domain Suppressor [Caenorhabditis elegans]